MAYSEIPVSLPAQARADYLIVSLPEEIDLFNAPEVRDSLLSAIAREGPWAIADMSRTRFCDAAGCRAVTQAANRARQSGIRLRAVVPSPAVRKVFRLTGADGVVEVWLSFDHLPPA
jgi:anti-sigma B factor antagonist